MGMLSRYGLANKFARDAFYRLTRNAEWCLQDGQRKENDMVKFYFEAFTAAAAFANKHGIPSDAIVKFGKRCEVHVPAEWAYEIRCAA